MSRTWYLNWLLYELVSGCVAACRNLNDRFMSLFHVYVRKTYPLSIVWLKRKNKIELNWILLFQFHFRSSSNNNQYNHPSFIIDDGCQPEVELMAKDRNVIAATFIHFLLKNIGTVTMKIHALSCKRNMHRFSSYHSILSSIFPYPSSILWL